MIQILVGRETYVPCCDYRVSAGQPYPVQWNEHNQVVQCHHCGTVYEPAKA